MPIAACSETTTAVASGATRRRRRRLHCVQVTVVFTERVGHAVELGRDAAQRGGVQVVAVAGGDGTLSEVVNGMMQAAAAGAPHPLPTLALLPLGTGNDFARTLLRMAAHDDNAGSAGSAGGGDNSPEAWLARLSLPACPLDVGRVQYHCVAEEEQQQRSRTSKSGSGKSTNSNTGGGDDEGEVEGSTGPEQHERYFVNAASCGASAAALPFLGASQCEGSLEMTHPIKPGYSPIHATPMSPQIACAGWGVTSHTRWPAPAACSLTRAAPLACAWTAARGSSCRA